MKKEIIETYPTYDGLEDIISETRAWYSALGLRMGGSLYSVIKASEGITGLVHAIAETLGFDNISKKVHIVVEEMPSIAYITPNQSQTIVHVGSWLYNREKMEQWHPRVSTMSENEMLVLTLGLINGAIALDMIAKVTESTRKDTVERVQRVLEDGYRLKDDSIIFAINVERSAEMAAIADEKFTYISSAIHDLLAMKACMTVHSNASWIMFPILMFREFFDRDFAYHFRDEIKKDDTLDNLIGCISALRCFSVHSASILDVESSIGINLIKALLAGAVEGISPNSMLAHDVLTQELLSAYIAEIKRVPPPPMPQDSESDDSKDKGEDGEKGSGAGNKQNGAVSGIEPKDSSAPINESVADESIKGQLELNADLGDDDGMDSLNYAKIQMQESLSENKKLRASNSKTRNWLEDFMRLAFNGKIKFNNEQVEMVKPRSFKSVDEYWDVLSNNNESKSVEWWLEHPLRRSFERNVINVYESIDKVSLKNLFMERTMDIEKSQPARSGIALIPTRIVNMFTDEKIFSPLPDAETERDSEVILLLDGSGSMTGRSVEFTNYSGERFSAPLYDSVTGAAYAIAEGLQRANVQCSVFTHTTLPHNDQVFVCKLTDPYSLNKRNEFIGADRIMRQNNGDGYAIEEVSQFFSQDGRDVGRTLIVLSDGQPAFGGYRNGHHGDAHTRKVAAKLREEGIKVYSISLTREVVRANDEIYGKENNFFPVDELGNGVVSLSPMLRKIVDIVSKNSVRSANNVLTQG